jgi:hypothetical protein
MAALLLAVLSLSSPALADEPSQAGLVVQFGDGRLETRCVLFESSAIRGDDLLARTDLEVVIDASSGMGITVCQIEGQGCAYPSEHCFCQCMGGSDCAYWNYFFRDPGGSDWIYSPLGAAVRRAEPGSVEAWVWGDGRVPPDNELTFEAICAPSTPTATQTAQPATRAPTTSTPALRSSAEPAPSSSPAQVEPTPTHLLPRPTAAVPADDGADILPTYWPFGLVILGLAAIGLAVWFRRA